MVENKVSQLQELYAEVAGCKRCALAEGRLRTVPGNGQEHPEIMFIGEAPGFHENQQGKPFVGPAGHLLDDLLALINLRRDDVYIANVIKCRPPNNRDPLPTEIEACAAFLERQITLLQPKVIVTLGRFSMSKFFPGETIGKIHGRPAKRGDIIVFPSYHPAAALHQPAIRPILMADIQKIPEILGRLQVPPCETPATNPTQLSLL